MDLTFDIIRSDKNHVLRRLLSQYLLIIFATIHVTHVMAQDLHHSQFYTSPLNLNPALTGVFNGDYRIAVNYRAQWFINELVQYQTVATNADMKILPRRDNAKGFWSIGFLFNHDQAGDSRLSLAHVGLSGAYTHAFSNRHIVSLGGLAGYGQRRFRTDDLVWDEQWDNGVIGPGPINEDLSNTSNGFLDVGAGIELPMAKIPAYEY